MKEFKVGETVVHETIGHYYSGIYLIKIVRETNKQYITGNGTRYWKETLSEVGNSRSKIKKYTPEIKAQYKKHQLVSNIKCKINKIDRNRNHFDYSSIEMSDLVKVHAQLSEIEALLFATDEEKRSE